MSLDPGADAAQRVAMLLLAANVMRALPSDAQIAVLAQATLRDMPGVADAVVSFDTTPHAGDPADERLRVHDLASHGQIFGSVRVAISDGDAYALCDSAVRNFVNLIGQEIEFRRTRSALCEANAQLERSALRFADFAHAASDWFWETDAEGRYVYLSAGLRRAGIDPARVVGRTRAEARISLELRVVTGAREIERAEALREPYRDLALRYRDGQGNEHHVELSGRPVFDAGGIFLGYRGCGRDVTAMERANTDLRRALLAEREMNAQQRRFVSVASHEFRTPLAVIDSTTQRLTARLAEAAPEIGVKLTRIRAAVQRMSQMIDRTLNSARLDEGRLELRPSRCELVGLLRTAIEQQRAITPGFDFAFNPGAAIATVVGDPRLLEHVFINLISNAVKFSGSCNRVEIELGEDDAGFSVAVRDFGIGIQPDEIERLFTRFYRTRAATGIAGTGIGLHLVKELVAMHGGEIRVQSAPGQGSTFRVTIPITPAAPVRELGAASAA